MDLFDWGLSDPRALDASASGGVIARVTAARGEQCDVAQGPVASDARITAIVPRRLRSGEGAPVTGDFVALAPETATERAVVRAVLPRRTRLVRRASGRAGVGQVVAANVDVVAIVTAAVDDFAPRRLERYLALVHESGAEPVVLVTKAGLARDLDVVLDEARRVARDVPVHAVDVLDGIGLDAARALDVARRTVALVGSSGVGKSTLLNHLLGQTQARTGAVRAHDGRGRHTTTTRELFVLPGGGLLLDTPGLREVGLAVATEHVDATFDDVTDLASECRFRDCSHAHEPGCAVRAAAEAGALDAERLASWTSLRQEAEAEAIRRDARLRRAEGKRFGRLVREAKRLKGS